MTSGTHSHPALGGEHRLENRHEIDGARRPIDDIDDIYTLMDKKEEEEALEDGRKMGVGIVKGKAAISIAHLSH